MAEKGGMFKDVMQAVEKLKALCAKPGTGYVDGIPLVDTEVFNEGWMLRLVVSALAEAPFLKKDGYRSSKIKEAIATIRRLSKKGWCSEGQLSPAHKNEGPTCADGLVGDIAISPTRSGKRKKWGFDGASGELCALEAKLGSMLAKGTTHSSKYNQVARYLSCLAKIELSKGCDLASCLYVIGPRIEKLEKQTDEYLEQDNVDYLVLGAMGGKLDNPINYNSPYSKWIDNETYGYVDLKIYDGYLELECLSDKDDVLFSKRIETK